MCKAVLAIFAVLLMLLAVTRTGHPTGQTAPLLLEVSSDKQSYNVGEPVTLFIKLQNATDSPVSLPPPCLLSEAHIWLTIFEGNMQVPVRTRTVTMSMGFTADLTLQPHESYTLQWKLPSVYYTLPYAPGKYRLCAHYKNEYRTFWIGEVHSECVTLKFK